ncbi:cation:proton antiporter [Streptomyces uncialis]|uniref:cation:proton antiporter n=1 Tax=Streptomyces uncialis TaxID=1048205 RepID=UPI003870BDD5|nr:cation:proton antiporter [Streptomyces uncialis]
MVVSAAPGAAPLPLDGVLFAVVVILVCCKSVGALARRLGQPVVIGEIAAGLMLGPSVLGAWWPEAMDALFPPEVLAPLHVLSQLGVVLFVYLAGLEVDLRLLRGKGRLTSYVSVTSIVIPVLLGVGFGVLTHERFAGGDTGPVPYALFLGVAMGVTALPVLARILEDSPLRGTVVATVALTCATVGDVVAWSLLAVVAGMVAASAPSAALTVALTVAFTAALVFVVRPALARMLAEPRFGATTRTGVLLLGALASAAVTEWIGVHAIFGAFLFGLAVPRDRTVVQESAERLGTVAGALLLPLFFAYSGLRTDLGSLAGSGAVWLWCLVAIAVAVAGKLGGTALGARAAGSGWRDSLRLGALMNCRGMTELVVLNVGLDLGVLSTEMFTALVVMAFVCTAMTWPVAGRLGRGRDGTLAAPPTRRKGPDTSAALGGVPHQPTRKEA